VAQAHEHPISLQLLADDGKTQLAFAQGFGGIAIRRPEAPVPQHDGPAAILAFGDRALEVAVVEGVVLGFDRQALVCRIEGGALGDGP
jgi:hypothetical protein